MEIENIYSAAGEDAIVRLVAEFYSQVPGDDILGPMYPKEDMEGAEHRLRGFLIFRFGGPQQYLQERGHPRLRMRHAPFRIDRRARDRWVQLMEKAMDASEFPIAVRGPAFDFLCSVADSMINTTSEA